MDELFAIIPVIIVAYIFVGHIDNIHISFKKKR